MKISLIQVPWDSGYLKERMGAGPAHLIEQGLIDHLRKNAEVIELSSITIESAFTLEIGTTKTINTLLAEKVRQAKDRNMFPVILAGNCNSSIGTTAGLQENNLGVIWFDAHADYNTPETSVSGFFDGMSLSVLAGKCWKDFAKSVPGFKPVDEKRIVLAAARDLDGKEAVLLKSSSITYLNVKKIREENFLSILPDSLKKGDNIYLHIDLDVFDTSELIVNKYSAAGGLFVEEFLEIIKKIKDKLNIVALAFTAYDPLFDKQNAAYNIVCKIIDTVITG